MNKKSRSNNTCAVAICDSPAGQSYHSFPKEPSLQKTWLLACQRKDKVNTQTAKICSTHFEEDCFQRDLRNELLGLKVRKLLLRGSVPTLHLKTKRIVPVEQKEDVVMGSILQNALMRGPVVENDPLPNYEPIKVEPPENTDWIKTEEVTYDEDEPPPKRPPPPTPETTKNTHEKIIKDLYDENMSLKRAVSSLKKENVSLKRKLKWWSSEKTQKEQLKKFLSKTHNPAQVKHILAPDKKFVKYCEKDISSALLLNNLDPKAYEYLRGSKQLVIPSRQTLKRWGNPFEVLSEVQRNSLKDLEDVAIGFEDDESQRLAVLDVLDSKKTNEREEGCKKAGVVRGIKGNWKHPLFLETASPMSKKLLFKVIEEVENVGIRLMGIVFNAANKSLFSDLELGPTKYSFPNPHDASRRIFCFPDVPHLLCLLRNNLLIKGFVLPPDKSGGLSTELGKKDFEALAAGGSAPHLSEGHVNPKEYTNRRVAPARQLLSPKTAKAFALFHGVEGLPQESALLLIHDWFHVSNSRQPYDRVKLKCALGKHEEDQLKVLDDMLELVSNIKVNGVRGLLMRWQKGIIVSIKSMKDLYEKLVKESSLLDYIVTSRLTFHKHNNVFPPHWLGDETESVRRIPVLIPAKDTETIEDIPSLNMDEFSHQMMEDLSQREGCSSNQMEEGHAADILGGFVNF